MSPSDHADHCIRLCWPIYLLVENCTLKTRFIDSYCKTRPARFIELFVNYHMETFCGIVGATMVETLTRTSSSRTSFWGTLRLLVENCCVRLQEKRSRSFFTEIGPKVLVKFSSLHYSLKQEKKIKRYLKISFCNVLVTAILVCGQGHYH